MKRLEPLFRILSDAALIVCAMLAAVCAIPSAFSVPFETGTLIWICALAAVLLAGWMHLPRIGVLFGTVFLIGAVAYGVFRRSAIADGAHYLWYNVLTPLSTDFSFLPVPEPIGEIADPASAVTALLTVAAFVFGLLVAFALIRGKLAVLTVLLPIPPFLLSLIYTNQPPEVWTATLLLLYIGGTMLGHGLRRNDAVQRPALTAVVIPMLLLLSFLLRTLSPAETFTPISFEQRQEMLGKTVGELRDDVLSWFKKNPQNVDLSKEGDRKEDESIAFSISASSTGTYLLRTHSYGQYKNGVWTSAADYDGEWKSMTALGNGQNGVFMSVSIRDAYSGERIVPYGFAEDPEVAVEENFVHAQGRTAYTWLALRSPNPYAAHAVGADERAYIDFAQRQYTMPDGEERDALLKILSEAGIETGTDAYETALNVAAFVRGSGTYSLTPGETPDGADFVRYFLTESHQGYCVHFASATAALLQACGIPARYTVGYRAAVPLADAWTDIPENAAHAWAEVYAEGVGWLPVESTAGYGHALQGERTETVQTAPSATNRPTPTLPPMPTPPSTEPTETNSAAPPLSTEPTETNSAAPPLPTEAGKTPEADAPTSAPKNVQEGKPLILDEKVETLVGEEPPRRIGAWWLLLLALPILTGGWLICGGAIRRRRKHRFLQKNAKAAILEMAAYHKRLERFGVKPDPDLDEWAEEAAFSNHAMTTERKVLYRRIAAAQDMLYRDAPIKRFIVRWILLVI